MMVLKEKRKCHKCGTWVEVFNFNRTQMVIKHCPNCGTKINRGKENAPN